MPPTTASAVPAKAKPIAQVATASAPAASGTVEGETKAKRTRNADLSETDRNARCIELIDDLYAADGSTEDGAKTKRGIRAKLRGLDKDWVNTHADYISTTYPERNKRVGEAAAEGAEVTQPAEAPAPKVAKAKKAAPTA